MNTIIISVLIMTFVSWGLTTYVICKRIRKNEETEFPLYLNYLLQTMVILNSAAMLAMPTPIDVYRGKTTLQITEVNGVPTDSSVVWKSTEQRISEFP